MDTNGNRMLFLRWLAKTHPAIFANTSQIVVRENMLGELEGWSDTIVAALTTVGAALIAKKTSDRQVSAAKAADAASRADALKTQLLAVNLERAKAGLAPVDANGREIASATLPVPAQLQSYYGAPASLSSINPIWLIAGAAGLLGIILLVKR